MRKLFILGVLLLVLPIVAGQDWLKSEEYEIGLNIGSEFTLVAETPNYNVEYVSAVLAFFPEDSWQQEVLSFSTVPEAKRINHHYEFKWLNPDAGDYEFDLDSEVRTRNDMQKVTDKVYFPVSVDEEYNKWLNPSEHIDSDDADIILQASNIAAGRDDLYSIAFELAKWINENIEYDIACGDQVEKASWVLDNMRGTCDEFTSLFVAMCRSLGIPARYIAGVAYSNIPEIEGFSPHAWAEVYFPDYGWVPFDPTYGQHGFVDASHVILKVSVDPDESSTTYEWQGLDADLETKKLQINAYMIKETGVVGPQISLAVDVAKDAVGFGSYNLVEADIENLNDYYFSTELYLAKPTELELTGNFNKLVLLKPNEKRKVYWLVKVPSSLKESSVYTFPIEVSSLRDISAETKFTASSSGERYNQIEIEELMEVVEEEKITTEKRSFVCDAENLLLAENESSQIECVVKNTGNVFLDNLAVCMDSICRYNDLGIQQKQSIYFMFEAVEPGKQDVTIKASNDEVYDTIILNFEVFDRPEIIIAKVDYPTEVGYDDNFSIKFELNKNSVSNPLNVVIKLIQDGYEREWDITEFSEDEGFVINLRGSDLRRGVNDFKLLAGYDDVRGERYSIEDDFSITLKKTGFWQTIAIWFNSLARWIEGVFS